MLDRVSDLRGRLQECGCDAFVSFSPPANRYLTGFRGTTSAVVVTLEEALLLCDFRYTELARRQARGYEVVEVKGTIELRAGEALAKRGVLKAAFDPTVLTVQQMSVLREGFQGALEPSAQLLAAMRMVKTADEIARIRAASELAEAALETMLGELCVGITEREAAMRLDAEFRRRGAEGPSFDTMVLFGPHGSQPHGAPGDTSLAPGDIVLVDCGCIRDGYCSDLTRTMAFGTIPATWFEEIYAVTLRAQQAALAAVRPGAIGREVDAVARNIIRGAGYGSHFGHGLGHGVGLEIHEPPRLNMESETVLEAGMIVTVEPGIYLPRRGGVRIEDLVAVTADGCTVLTQSSTQLRVLSI
jgi:Xaa-Pro aminopeptidase